MATLPIENIVLFGRTGNGKSATGNSIAGKNLFESKARAAGVTRKCQAEIVERPEGPKLRVIDTPGILDPKELADYISEEVVRCLHLAEGGLHAVLVVLSLRNRFTQEEEIVLRTLQVIFGSKIVDNIIVVFTCGDELDETNTIDNYLSECPDFLKKLLASCGNRRVVFENKTKDEAKKTKQVQELLNLIDRLRKNTGYKPYTEDMYLKIKAEADRHKKEHEELAKKEHLYSEEEFEELKKELLLINEQNLKAMAEMMKENIKMVMEAQQKLIEHIEKQEEQRELAEEKRRHEEEQMHQQETQKMIDQMESNHRKEMEAEEKLIEHIEKEEKQREIAAEKRQHEQEQRELAAEKKHQEGEQMHQQEMQKMLAQMESNHRQEMAAQMTGDVCNIL